MHFGGLFSSISLHKLSLSSREKWRQKSFLLKASETVSKKVWKKLANFDDTVKAASYFVSSTH